jgi:hypothetical protein
MAPGAEGTGPALLPHHAALLTASALATEVIAARGYRSLTRKAELRALGFGERQLLVPTLLVPVWGVAGVIATYQHRPDAPRIVDGKGLKYETPKGTRMALDVPPGARPWLGDLERPLFVTEGARKADSAVSVGLCCVALLGVWNWRGTNADGGTVVLPDWESIALKSRRVYIAFDSDVMEKAPVAAALKRLRAFLASRGADVWLIYLPPGSGGAKVGLDDYLAARHTVGELLALATTTLREPPEEAERPSGPYYAVGRNGGLAQLTPEYHGGERIGDRERPLTNFAARIIADVAEDDGAETRRAFELEARLGERTTRFTIAAAQFASLNWATEHLGARAIVYPGHGIREHARVAVQELSGDVAERRVYTHLGWRRIGDAWAYLHAGGAIGPGGGLAGIEVQPPRQLARYVLPEPPASAVLGQAIRASLNVWTVGPRRVMVPMHASIYRAAMAGADFSLYIVGQSGGGKSSAAALAEQHFGAEMDARHLPAEWLSTGNALEALAFAAKDTLLVVDDFAPDGARPDVQRMHRDAARVFRAQGNRSGRQRMRADGSLVPAKPPRGLILSTGEDTPHGQSVRARMLVLELALSGPGGLDWARLGVCQADAAAGLYTQALAGFVQWLAADYEKARQALHADAVALRAIAARSAAHRRTPEIVAHLAVGLRAFLTFARTRGVLTEAEVCARWAEGWAALGEAAAAQVQHQADTEPARRFITLLAATIASGRAHVAAMDGSEPETPDRWGWRLVTIGSGEYQRTDWQPRGERVGWIDGDALYLEPDAAFAIVQALAQTQGEPLPVAPKTLAKRLKERSYLASTELGRETLRVRRPIQGQRRAVLHLMAASLAAESDQPDQPDPNLAETTPGLGPAWSDFGAKSVEPDHVARENLTNERGSEDGVSRLAGQVIGGLWSENGDAISESDQTASAVCPTPAPSSKGNGQVGQVGQILERKTHAPPIAGAPSDLHPCCHCGRPTPRLRCPDCQERWARGELPSAPHRRRTGPPDG